jgi:hypothetical protein
VLDHFPEDVDTGPPTAPVLTEAEVQAIAAAIRAFRGANDDWADPSLLEVTQAVASWAVRTRLDAILVNGVLSGALAVDLTPEGARQFKVAPAKGWRTIPEYIRAFWRSTPDPEDRC